MSIAEILPPALPGSPGPHGFQKGHPKYRPKATGKRGCQGFIEWLALHEPKTAAALFAAAFER